jgi:site-specific DNA-methyltransferase (adenine-specific)
MKKMAEASVDAIVTDPPYGLEFMGKEWDAPWKQTSGGFSEPGIGDRKTKWPSFKGSNRVRCGSCGMLVGQGGSKCKCENPRPVSQDAERMRAFQDWAHEWAVEALRVAKPGAHILVFGGTRTYHRMTCALEDAGWEIRDCVMWVYGSGFPKSLDVSKAIDKTAGAEREIIGPPPYKRGKPTQQYSKTRKVSYDCDPQPITAPATDAARQWSGWGTALKPAWEPIIVARKPLVGTVAENVLKHGTGAMNIDGCRVGTEQVTINTFDDGMKPFGNGAGHAYSSKTVTGRFPANLIHDGSEEVMRLFPDTGKSTGGRTIKRKGGGNVGSGKASEAAWSNDDPGFGDSGSAGRFFYTAKANKSDRGKDNIHPTVKPTDLMRYLCRLVTPPNGIVLDPFMGSGSTGKAALLEGFRFVGIELSEEYANIARKRLDEIETPSSLMEIME